ncbi:extracellular solute-binding protein [Actinomyces sp. B33]|uniref:ABC transporter substrate-binding protein n=1 Tax=Actinomyces sp. B33 TaxID=2942131 RepID=UPI0023414E84|nr:extracellular solute-binding protein [Actinomyces sp. B33]MDC4233841.1 extracellular solute-binding protein [Actinomyces sp. B33]
MKMRYTALAVATAMTASLGLAACSGGSGSGTTATADGTIALTWDMWGSSDTDLKWIEDTANVVREQNPDIELTTNVASWGDYFTKLTSNMSSGQLSCLTSMNGQKLSVFHPALSPLTDEDLATAGIDPADFTDGALDILTYDGTLYGIPYDVAAMLVYYNKDMLAETGTPEPVNGWTFDDFVATAKGATTDAHKGFGMGMGEFQWLALPIAKSGVQPVAADGTLQLTDPKFVEAAEWYASLATAEGVADPVPSASEAGWGEDQYSSANTAMAVDGTWNAQGYFTNEKGFAAGAVTLPKNADGSSVGLVLGSGFGIAATCQGPEREAALKVLGSLVSKEAQDLISSSGRSYPSRVESQPLYFDSLDEAYREDVRTVFEAAFSGLQGQHVNEKWAQVSEYFTPNLVSVYTGDSTMADMLGNAQKQFGQN